MSAAKSRVLKYLAQAQAFEKAGEKASARCLAAIAQKQIERNTSDQEKQQMIFALGQIKSFTRANINRRARKAARAAPSVLPCDYRSKTLGHCRSCQDGNIYKCAKKEAFVGLRQCADCKRREENTNAGQ